MHSGRALRQQWTQRISMALQKGRISRLQRNVARFFEALRSGRNADAVVLMDPVDPDEDPDLADDPPAHAEAAAGR